MVFQHWTLGGVNFCPHVKPRCLREEWWRERAALLSLSLGVARDFISPLVPVFSCATFTPFTRGWKTLPCSPGLGFYRRSGVQPAAVLSWWAGKPHTLSLQGPQGASSTDLHWNINPSGGNLMPSSSSLSPTQGTESRKWTEHWIAVMKSEEAVRHDRSS